MTTLKTADEVTETIRKALNLREELIDGTDEIAFVKNTITQDRQHVAQVLYDLLEGIRDNESDGYYKQAIGEAQALIRQTLDPISNQE